MDDLHLPDKGTWTFLPALEVPSALQNGIPEPAMTPSQTVMRLGQTWRVLTRKLNSRKSELLGQAPKTERNYISYNWKILNKVPPNHLNYKKTRQGDMAGERHGTMSVCVCLPLLLPPPRPSARGPPSPSLSPSPTPWYVPRVLHRVIRTWWRGIEGSMSPLGVFFLTAYCQPWKLYPPCVLAIVTTPCLF